ncbi:MAG: tRNA pseudouridine(54/55) synthase Pus10 [archaeon]|jgi:tRNA pseudouridine synthase 10
MLNLDESLVRDEKLIHELKFRDKIKSAEYHYSVDFAFDGFFEDELIKALFEKIKLLSKEIEFNSFKLGCSWPEVGETEKVRLKTYLQGTLVKMIETDLGKKVELNNNDLDFLIDFNKKLVFVRIRSVYVIGNYCKNSREIAQTEFFCNKCRGRGCWYCNSTGHFSSESVEQLIAKVMIPAFDGKLLILHGAGREDMDVLMLGKGRPFIAEILLPMKRTVDLKEIEEKINSEFKGKISVNSLKMCLVNDVSQLKNAFHDKVYAALVTSDAVFDFSKLETNKTIIVKQNTPTRVEKRRALMERNKEVTILRVGKITEKEFVLVLRTSHGTYVKEFISGDEGKTDPSISKIVGAYCMCKLLDVLEICEEK